MINSKISNITIAPTLVNQKQVSQKTRGDFDSMLVAQNPKKSIVTTEPQSALSNITTLKIEMPDGRVLDVMDTEKIQKELIDFAIQSENEAKQHQAEMVKQEAEMVKKDAETTKSFAEFSPAEQKEYLMAQKLEAVVRDKEGNIVAKLYKNGFSMNLVDSPNSQASPLVKLRQFENTSDFTVTHYDGNFSDYDLLPEDMAYAKKDWLKRPELYSQQLIQETQKYFQRLLAA